MNGRKPGETSGSVLSFTYLDVLVCTMGSLLLMLVMFGEKAKRVAIAEAKAEDARALAAAPPAESAVAPPAEDPQALAKLLADVQAHQADLARMRDQARQTLLDEQQRATHLEEHQRRLEHDLGKLNLTLRTLQATEDKQSVDQDVATKELDRLAKLVADTEKRVEDMRKEGVGKRSYAIVPYKGPNGTDRRPIFIECTHDAIIIQPEGVKLTEVDFEGPIGSGNPLAAAVRAAQEELNARARAAGETEPPDPYPLFIVRPDGVNAYAVALAATRTWDSDFGYEFVEADWKLEYPQPDARLAQITQHAIEQARERQKLLAAAAPRRYAGRMTGRAGGGGGRGGSGPDGSVGGEGDFGDATTAGGDADGKSSVQLAGGASGNGGTFAEETAQAYTAGGNAGGGYPGQQYDNRYGERGGGQGAGTPGYPGGPGGSGEFAESGSTQQPAAGAGQGASAPSAGGAQGAGGQQPANGAPASANSFATAGSGYSSSSATSSATSSSDSRSSAAGTSGSGNQSPEAFDPHATPGSAERQAASAAGAASSGQPEGAAGVGLPASLTKDKNVESAAKTRGENWANAAARQRSSAITRPIHVVIRPNQLAVLDPNEIASGGSVVSFDQPSDRVLDELAAAVKRQVADWGIAGRGMYWRPELVFAVTPGSEPYASRLAALLEDSGVDVRLPASAEPNVAARPQEDARATR